FSAWGDEHDACEAAPVRSSIGRPRGSILFPYTTLFRSAAAHARVRAGRRAAVGDEPAVAPPHADGAPRARAPRALRHRPARCVRSEEHTSELQSRENLVCRLLLEKKTGECPHAS